ncbi:MAG TPA: hypothetical protein VJ904_13355, partial [Tichowtungia sp.]|nr:hypothetical protein [Tichowtungia sp.]
MKRLVSALFVTVALACGCSANPDPVDTLRETGKAFTRVAKIATPAVVSIRVEQTVETPMRSRQDILEYFFGPQLRGQQQQQPRTQQRRQMGQGS